jgi:predicted transcriptional regulator
VKTSIELDQIRTDGGTQPRAALDFDAVDDYMDAMAAGINFPPVIVFHDGDNYWLADGFHRVKAADQAGLDEILCEIHHGTQQDAQWYSYSANKANGLRRTNDDKGRAVQAALVHPKGVSLSDRKIAKHVGVDHSTVLRWREKLSSCGALHHMNSRSSSRGGSEYTYRIASAGAGGAKVAALESVACWAPRLSRFGKAIANQPVPVADLVNFIRNSPERDQITTALERTYAFLTELKSALE